MLYTFSTVIQGERAQNVTVRAHISVSQICMYQLAFPNLCDLTISTIIIQVCSKMKTDYDTEIQTEVSPSPAFVTVWRRRQNRMLIVMY